jgi:hypothetical protein
MIVAYSRGDGAATNYEIARVTVALQHLRTGDDSWARIDPVRRWLQTLWFGGRSSGHVAAPASLLALAAWQSGHGAMRGKLDVASPVSCFAVSAAQSFLAFTLSARPKKVHPTLGAEWERQDAVRRG